LRVQGREWQVDLSRHRRMLCATVILVAVVFVILRLGAPAIIEAHAWERWEAEHFDKRSVDLARVLAMVSIATALYVWFQRHARSVQRILGRLLFPFGRNSFDIFIMHVFVCLAVASLPSVGADGLGSSGTPSCRSAALRSCGRWSRASSCSAGCPVSCSTFPVERSHSAGSGTVSASQGMDRAAPAGRVLSRWSWRLRP
jgi:OpgC protein